MKDIFKTLTVSQRLRLGVAVAALGYFVDVFDIVLFNIVRVPSLQSLSLSQNAILETGITLLNLQMIGMLLGSFFWGIMGDKIGRIQVLFGSIFLYSSANIANAFISSVEMYGACRFVAGFGMAGEVGAAVTLVAELLSKEKRGIGTAIGLFM